MTFSPSINLAIKGAVAIGKGTRVRSGCYIEGPVSIGEGCDIGPNVTIERGSVIRDSTLTHAIVGERCTLTGVALSHSLLGNDVVVRDFRGTASLGDHSELIGSG